MDNRERRTLRTIFIVAAVLGGLAVAAVALYHAERRVRRLLYLLEQRLMPKSSAMKVEL